MSRSDSKGQDANANDTDRKFGTDRGQSSNFTKQEAINVQTNTNERRMCILSEFSVLQGSDEKTMADIKEQIAEAKATAAKEMIDPDEELMKELKDALAEIRATLKRKKTEYEAYKKTLNK